jgi:hypothetical protein
MILHLWLLCWGGAVISAFRPWTILVPPLVYRRKALRDNNASPICKALPWFFLCIFSSLPALRNLFSAMGIFCSGRYQPGLHWDLLISGRLPGQRITISKMWKNPSSALSRKGTWVQTLLWFLTCSFPWHTGLEDGSQITEGAVL